MPQNQQQSPTGSQKMFIDLSGRGGLAPRWFGDEGDTIAQNPQYRYIGTQDQVTPILGETTASDMAAGTWNPSRRYGYMSPANNTFVTITTPTLTYPSFTGEQVAEIATTCYDPGTATAFFAEGQSINTKATIFQSQNGLGNLTNWTTNANFSWPLADCSGFTSIKMYQINGAPFLFAVYNNNSTGFMDILVMDPGGSATGASSVWLSTVASGSFNCITGDAFLVPSTYYMYLIVNNTVHRIDGTSQTGGTNGTALSNVLIASANITFTDAISWNGSLWLAGTQAYFASSINSAVASFPNFTYATEQTRVYVWDESVTTIENVQYITITGVIMVSKMYVTRQGKLRMICVSSNLTVQVREYNGTTFDVLEDAAANAFPRYRDSVQIAGDCVQWVGNDGNIYSYGPVAVGEVDQLNIIGSMASAVTLSDAILGACLYIDNFGSASQSPPTTAATRTGLFLCARSSNYNLIGGNFVPDFPAVNVMWHQNAQGGTPHIGNVFTLVKFFQTPVKVNYCRVYHYIGLFPGSSTTQGTLSVYLNQVTTPQKTFTITNSDVAKGWKYCPVNQGAKNAVFAIQAEIQWATNISITDGVTWMPRVLEIDYTPLDKLQ